MAADWLLIAAVIGLVIAVFWAIGQVIDACIGVWRTEEEEEHEDPSRRWPEDLPR